MMKKYHLITYFCSLLLLLSTCSGQQNPNGSTVSIDIEANIKNMKIVNMSQFTENIKYVPLENKEIFSFGYIHDFDISGDMILVNDGNVCILYDMTGHYISQFGSKGRGPTEYQFITNLTFSKDNKIYLKSGYDLFEYRRDGSFVKKYSKTFMINDKYQIGNFFLIEDSLFLGHVPNSTGQMEYKALLFDKFRNVKKYYKNYILFNPEYKRFISTEAEAFYYRFQNSLYYKDIYNDTLFHLNNQYQLLPEYVFNLGKYKEPSSSRETINPKSMEKYIYIYSVFQTEGYLFLDCHLNSQYPAKRLTPKVINLPTNTPVTSWYNGRSVIGIFDIKTHSLTLSKPTSTDNPLFTSGLYNDIDAGPRFYPHKMINDSTMCMFIKADDLKNHVDSDDFKNSVPKFPEKKKQLEVLANKLTEYDNPVLMIVTFKK